MDEESKGYLELILYSLFVGVVGVFVKLVQGLDAFSITFFRAAIATIFILGTLILLKRTKELAITHSKKLLLVGIVQGLSIILYFIALLSTTVSNAVFLLYTAPIFSVIFSRFFLKEEIERKTIIAIFVTLLGIIFILDPTTFSFDSSSTIGNLLALTSGFFYAAMMIIAKPVLKERSGYSVAFWQYFVITLMFLPFLKFNSASVILSNWWQLGIIGIVCTGIAFMLFMEGVRKIKAQKVFVITTLEPLAGTALALLLLNEVPSLFTAIGAALILYGVYGITKK